MWFLISSLICFTLMGLKTILNINKKQSPGILLIPWIILFVLSTIEFIIWTMQKQQQIHIITILFFIMKIIGILLPKHLVIEASNRKIHINILKVEQRLKRQIIMWYFWFLLRVLSIDYRQMSSQQKEQMKQKVDRILDPNCQQKKIQNKCSQLISELNLYKSPLLNSIQK